MSALQLNREWIDKLATLEPGQLPGKDLPWLDNMRQQAHSEIPSLGLPYRKLEAWRYTSVDKLTQQPFVYIDDIFNVQPVTDIEDWILNDTDSYHLVFANGRCIPRLSNIQGLSSKIRIGSLRANLAIDPDIIKTFLANRPSQGSQDIFLALNTAFINDGLFIHIPKNVRIEKPIEVLYLNLTQEDAPLILPRNLVVLDSGAEATLIERFSSTGKASYFNNSVTEIFVNNNAHLTHCRLQDESEQSCHLSHIKLEQGADSSYHGAHFALGARWARSEIDVRFSGKGANCELNGLYMVKDNHLADFHLNVVHHHSHCTSRENFRGILTGKGRAVFDGRILVEKNAQKTDAHLSNKNLLLSREAEVDTKPQLEINADDVKCSHGTTVGQLDPKQIFYLRSRGISENDARRMLCIGFAGEILEKLALDEVKSFVESRIHEHLISTINGN